MNMEQTRVRLMKSGQLDPYTPLWIIILSTS